MLKRKMAALALTVPMVLSVACKKSETTREVKDHSQEIITVSDSKETKASTSEEKHTTDDDVKMIDPFKDLKVNISGAEGFPEVTFDTSACDKFIQDNVEFSYETEDAFLNIGEHIIVKAKFASDSSTLEVEGTKYGLKMDSMSLEATGDKIVCLVRDNETLTGRNQLRTNIEEMIPPLKDTIVEKMMMPVKTDDGTLSVVSCDTKIEIRATNTILCMNTASLDYTKGNSKGNPITDIYLLFEMSGKVSGTISETNQPIEKYSVVHYAILHIQFPGYGYAVNGAAADKVELLYTDDIDEYIKNIKEEYKNAGEDVESPLEEYENKLMDYIKSNFTDTMHAGYLFIGVSHPEPGRPNPSGNREFQIDFQIEIEP